MFITKKKFEEIIEKRVERERRITRIEERSRKQEELNRKLVSRIRNVESRLDRLEEEKENGKGTIKRYYLNSDGYTIPCSKCSG